MYKVMTRAQRRPGTRPPGRHDTRRPGGGPGVRASRPANVGGAPAARVPVAQVPAAARVPAARVPAARTADAPGHAAPAAVATAPLPSRPETAPRPAGGPCLTSVRTRGGRDASAAAAAASRPSVDPVTTDVFAEKLLAVLSGQRPVHWMLRHTVGQAYDELARLAARLPLRARGTRPVVRDIGHCEPRPGALEVFARIAAGDQLRALAFRLERDRDLRWRCTAVELGGPRTQRSHEA
ncbi:Rv3235 family protein [Streptomyces thermoviolaceus]|uniref:Uncharacterized protein n=1 Tax=Streptomyces thermoviolaceus subsp. thermoviolaceus TaxID=66860 RepID=A0ABX0YYQ7_STRTL|nr:Rv3235 family protein [Streptomyces thermoviolaceus]MCM3265472.1 Rv3235 family protein [Streptomyces thermoviolaceus]NJP16193.1 hypothetical protein [Streptomyces thermoviolaceus subsp. thermoviolaceus]RSS00287.1 hypothetical protein EF917_17660 [Streptomyces sp. WAC00469]GHB08080.1 hypothetical protein GCM10010512_44560 [Streptomyces thermoviolaceus subsp. thermoviolaceus]